ncbi:MAG TPA: amidohydrolase family protein [Syntrophorhabdales bacterium]|nr:amidohydrolase family protein [Syntrophorhabdales bacterium]
MIVDIFCHHVSHTNIEIIEKARWEQEGKAPVKDGPRKFACPIQNADPEARLSIMDKYGINVQAVSLTMESLDGFDAEMAASTCERANSDNYALCKAHPDRFVNICAISLLNMKSAMNELDRAVNELDCRGVTVATNQNGKGLDSPEYFPFYEKLTRHDLPLFLHPCNWKSYPLADESQWMFMSRFGWPFDTTQAVWRLIFGGVLDRFPTLKVVMHHLGAMFPYFAGRIQSGLTTLRGKLPRDFSDYWKNIYGDSALSGGPVETYACGYAFLGPDHVLYGSDYPFGPESGEQFIRANMAGLTSLKIPPADMEKILGGNAKKLLKIK